MILSVILAIVFLVLAVIFLMGKGDKLIAGYNTLSEAERKEVDIHRLRILMAVISVVTACYCTLLSFIGEHLGKQLVATFVFILITLIFVILANTWTKRK